MYQFLVFICPLVIFVGAQELFQIDSCEEKHCHDYHCLMKKFKELEDKYSLLEKFNTELKQHIIDKDKEIINLKQNLKNCESVYTTHGTVNQSYSTSGSSVSDVNTTTGPTVDNIPDSQGTDFVLVFTPNLLTGERIELIMTSKEYEATIELYSPEAGISQNILLVNHTITVSLNSAIVTTGTTIQTRGLYIKSSEPISVHGVSVYECCSSGGFTALPYEMLGTRYIVASYHPYFFGSTSYFSQIGIAAIYDITKINVTLNTTGTVYFNGKTYSNGDTISLFLHRLNTVLLKSHHDLTGTVITSEKIIAVSASVDGTYFPITDLEFVVATMPPVNQWGKSFVLSRFDPSSKMILRVVPSDLDVNVEIENTGGTQSFQTNQTIEIILSSADIHFVYCSKPCLVVQFCADQNFNPFMVAIPSVEQFLNKYEIMRPTLKSFYDYISGTIETRYLNGLLYDGISISGKVTTALDRNNVSWSSFSFQINNSFSVIRHSSENVRFGLVQYGFSFNGGNPDAYAFPVALSSIISNRF